MAAQELTSLTVAQAARLIKSRKLSPVELVEASLKRVEELDSRLRAFITVLWDQAMVEARRAEADISNGRYKGPLHGIPISLKDLFYTKGILTTAGTRVFQEFVPDFDATVTVKLREAGAILIGKNNMHEMAAGATNENPFYGNAQNPWKLGYITAGSSGGSAVAVTTGMGLASMGSDTGGSIRMPAAFCGIVGHKPTYGLVSRYGVFALSWSLDHVGPMTRTVEDAAIMLTAVAGYDPRDSGSARTRRVNYSRNLRRAVKGLSLGVPSDPYFKHLAPEIRRVTSQAVKALEDMGAKVRQVSLPSAEHTVLTNLTISFSETAAIYEEQIRHRFHLFSPQLQEQLLIGLSTPAYEYLDAQRIRALVQREFREALTKVDLIVMPTAPLPAYPIGTRQVEFGGEKLEAMRLLARFTRPANQSGYPALSVPCGFTRDGLPVGFQIVGRPFEDALVLQAGYAYQQATDWHRRRPQL